MNSLAPAVALLFAVSAVFGQQVSAGIAAPGKLVDVDGHRLHINCKGRGKQTVIMEAGAGDFSFDWSLVQPLVSRFARACTYDRAGYAWSEPGPTPRTLRQIAFELHSLLRNAGRKGPFILVGHSLGGLIVREFARLYPDEAAGMVLVDSAHEDQLVGITDRNTNEGKIVKWRELSRGRPIPAVQAAMPPSSTSQKPPGSTGQTKVGSPFDKLSLPSQKMRLWAISQPNYNPARISEFDFIAEELTDIHDRRAKNGYPFGDMPLIVVSHGIDEYPEQDRTRLAEDHRRLQTDLLNLSRNSKQVIATTGRHHVQIDAPEVVADAIREVIDSVRQHRKMPATR